MSKYKLCRVYERKTWEVFPLGDKGEDITVASMEEFSQDDPDYYYAIYENEGTENMPDWSEYDDFGDNLAEAVAELKKLKNEERIEYLKEKEKVCPLDKGELYELQTLINGEK